MHPVSQMEEERLATVERDNRMLLEKMATIMRTQGRVDHRNDYDHKSLNREKRNRELLEIAQQNQAILKRIQARQANYSHESQQRDYFQSEELRANITRFPGLVLCPFEHEKNDLCLHFCFNIAHIFLHFLVLLFLFSASRSSLKKISQLLSPLGPRLPI